MVRVTANDARSLSPSRGRAAVAGGATYMSDGSDHDDRSYLVSVAYESDAERKRAEYLLDNWDDGSIESLRGLTRQAHDVEIDDLYGQLVAKVPEDHVHVFELAPVETHADTVEETLEYTVDVDPDRVEWAMESLMNKRKAIAEDATNNEYALYTKKGRAKVAYTVDPTPAGDVRLRIRIQGYGEAATFLKEFFEEELSYMVT